MGGRAAERRDERIAGERCVLGGCCSLSSGGIGERGGMLKGWKRSGGECVGDCEGKRLGRAREAGERLRLSRRR